MSDEYTPKKEQIRAIWCAFSEYGGLVDRPRSNLWDDRLDEFNRWYAAEIRKAKAEGIRAAASACRALVNMQMDETRPYEMLEEMDKMAARFEEPR